MCNSFPIAISRFGGYQGGILVFQGLEDLLQIVVRQHFVSRVRHLVQILRINHAAHERVYLLLENVEVDLEGTEECFVDEADVEELVMADQYRPSSLQLLLPLVQVLRHGLKLVSTLFAIRLFNNPSRVDFLSKVTSNQGLEDPSKAYT